MKYFPRSFNSVGIFRVKKGWFFNGKMLITNIIAIYTTFFP